jgi:anti-sigma factor RsiW
VVTRKQNDHIDEETLELYALGRLAEEEAAPVEEHLLVCHSCQDRLASTDEFIRTVRAAASNLPPKKPKQKGDPKSFWRIPFARTHDA